ncbi:ABC transporter permease [Microbacterium sp. JAI119]|uniref:ABC transporter permease n=1 Tax=Microbacterium sp. JAI119 TaxID=2723062 RepID=UPI0015CC8992|nr:ABC transporter permease [Microbacterium sp. JAI119]NYF28093.1 ribose/xylose/arabinose/galactoside ABC-type transport system permease subunit [Microbacterium sp. JAI119]
MADPRSLRRVQLALLPILLIVEFIVFSLLSPRFFTPENLANIAYNSAGLALVAAGVTLVVILGGIDVSTGFAVGIVAWTVAKLSGAGLPAFVVVVAAVVVGALLGAINGILVTFGKVPPIIATLGTAAIFQTALFALWNSNDLFAAPVAPIFSGERVLGVPMVVVPVIIVYAVLAWFMYKRPAGRELYATGSNPEAARLAGIRVNRLTFLAYLTIGVLVGLAGLIYVGRVGVVQASSGNEVTLLAIAAVVVGGTSILGGEGSVLRTLGGLVFIVVLQNGIVLAGVPPLWNGLMVGTTIILAVTIDVLAARKANRPLLRGLA